MFKDSLGMNLGELLRVVNIPETPRKTIMVALLNPVQLIGEICVWAIVHCKKFTIYVESQIKSVS